MRQRIVATPKDKPISLRTERAKRPEEESMNTHRRPHATEVLVTRHGGKRTVLAHPSLRVSIMPRP